MSEQVTTAATENQNKVATEADKTAVKTETTSTAAPATTTETKVDAATATTEQPKPEDKKTETPVVPVFELKKADGSLLPASEAEKIVSFSKEHGLSPAQAQALFNRENATVAAANQAYEAEAVKQYEQRKVQWVEEVKNDPVMGGEHVAKNVQAAHQMLQKFSTPAFTKLLDETGFGNHPELLRVFYNMSKANQDDTFVRAGQPTADRKATSDILYDNTK